MPQSPRTGALSHRAMRTRNSCSHADCAVTDEEELDDASFDGSLLLPQARRMTADKIVTRIRFERNIGIFDSVSAQ